MDKQKVVNCLKEFFSEKKDIRVGYLFSSFAREEHDSISDVDVGIVGVEELPILRLARFTEELKEKLDREVDVVDLRDKGFRFIHNILKDAEVIVNRDEDLRVDFESYILVRYLDMKPFYRKFDNALRERYEG